MLRCWGIEPLVIYLGVFLGVSICTTIERRKGYREIILLTPFNKTFLGMPFRGCTCLKCTNKAKGAPTKQKVHQQNGRCTSCSGKRQSRAQPVFDHIISFTGQQ